MFVMLFLQVFGSLLSTKADKKEDEPDGAEKEEKDQQVLVKKFSLSKETFLIFYLLIYAQYVSYCFSHQRQIFMSSWVACLVRIS